MQSYFITVEGIEGAGKSTQLQFMEQYLRTAGCTVTSTREPGGTQLGEQIRHLLLSPRDQDIAPESELLLLFAARIEHVQKVINPALAAGHWVLCDRFSDASYAYQGAGRGLSFARIEQIERWSLGALKPNLTFLFDTSVAQGLARVARRGQDRDRIEAEQADFFERIRAAYLERAATEPTRYQVIDSSQSIEQIHAKVQAVLSVLLAQQQ